MQHPQGFQRAVASEADASALVLQEAQEELGKLRADQYSLMRLAEERRQAALAPSSEWDAKSYPFPVVYLSARAGPCVLIQF